MTSQELTVKKSSVFSGLSNLLRLENSKWLANRRWLIQSFVWFFLINGIGLLVIVNDMIDGIYVNIPTVPEMVAILFQFMGTWGAIGVIVLTQGAIIKEKQLGTMSWVLSSPVARLSVILSKLVVNALYITGILVFLQGSLGYLMLNFSYGPVLSLNAFIASLGIQSLHLLFWLSLSLMLGVFFRARGPLLGISLGFMFLQPVIGSFLGRVQPWLQYILPDGLVVSAIQVALSEPLTTNIPLLSGIICVICFTALAAWRFEREEF